MKLQRINVKGFEFDIRPETSDLKAIREVVDKNGYKRKGYEPADGEHWIDIGANVGAFSVWAASYGATVEAFEPDPESAELARHNLKLNGFSRLVTVSAIALTAQEQDGTAEFHRNSARGNVWRNSLYKKWKGGETITVPTAPVEQYWQPKNCIKLDAEGAEMPILERYATSPVRKLIFEWSFDIDNSLTRFEKVIDELQRTYNNVHHQKYQSGYETWQPSWFPPCRSVWSK